MLSIYWLTAALVISASSVGRSSTEHDWPGTAPINNDPRTNDPGARPVLKSNETGGTGGSAFDDILSGDLLTNNLTGIQSIVLTYNDQNAASIQVTYSLSNGSAYKAPQHGGSGENYPKTFTIKLVSGDYVKRVEGTSDKAVEQLSIATANRRSPVAKTYGPFGGAKGGNFSFEGVILGFYGRAGSLLDSLGYYKLSPVKKSDMWGGTYSTDNSFDENPDKAFNSPVVKIERLFIYHGGHQLNAIQAEYRLLGGARAKGKVLGVRQGTRTIIEFSKDEKIVSLQGTGYYGHFCQLTFVSRKGDGSTMYYGPFGGGCAIAVNFEGNIMGFHGTVRDSAIDGFGVYYI